MKLLICSHDRPHSVNGPNVWLQRILPELRKKGVDSKLLFFPVGDSEKCPTIQALKKNGFTCEIYTGLKYTEHKLRWILEKVKEDPPDIFFPNLSIPGFHASKLLKDSGIPTVGILHSNDSFYRSIVNEFIEKPEESYLSAVVCVSKFLEDFVNKSSVGKLKIQRIPYGVPVPSNRARPRNGKLKLIYAGRFVEHQKRISDVTRSLSKLAQRLPDIEVVLYGSGPAEEDMKKILKEHESQSVKLGGLLKSDELQQRFLDAQVFVLLSDYEGLPIALMEAMSCGLVPVCYNMDSGIPELIEHEKSGLIVNDREDTFFQAIERLLSENGLWEKLSDGARQKIKESYSIQSLEVEWKKLLTVLIEDNPEQNKPLKIPKKFNLPPRNPGIKRYDDKRWPGYFKYYKARANNLKNRIIR